MATTTGARRLPPPDPRPSIVRIGVPLLFAAALGVAYAVTLLQHTDTDDRAQTAPSPAVSLGAPAPTFIHHYPVDPAVPERPKVTGPPPRVPGADVIRGPLVLRSITAMKRALPRGVLTREGSVWTLHRAVEIRGATLSIRGPATLRLRPGAFVLASQNALVRMRRMTVEAVRLDGRAAMRPGADRGFIAVIEGARLKLLQDRILRLGHLGDLAYGIALRQPGHGSLVSGCTIKGNYFGVYTSHGVGVRIIHNHIANSWVYGIDPQIESKNVYVGQNLVTGSGIHGIVLSARDRGVRVIGNTIRDSRLHGIVIYRQSDGNVVRGNRVTDTFDGIVVTDSSRNAIDHNLVYRAHRFGLRMSGHSDHNRVSANVFEGAMVGAYVYGGASENAMLRNRYRHDRENVRIRGDAPRNRVAPVPGRSEVTP